MRVCRCLGLGASHHTLRHAWPWPLPCELFLSICFVWVSLMLCDFSEIRTSGKNMVRTTRPRCRLLDFFAARRGGQCTLVVATTGDTGPAAIAACTGAACLRIFVNYPLGTPPTPTTLRAAVRLAWRVHLATAVVLIHDTSAHIVSDNWFQAELPKSKQADF